MVAQRFCVETADDTSLLTLSGHLDLSMAADLEDVLTRLLASGTRHAVLDCSGLSFLGSHGISVLMGYTGRYRERGGELKLCALSREVRDLLALVGVDRLLSVFDDVAGAVLTGSDAARRRLRVQERRRGCERRRGTRACPHGERRQGERRGQRTRAPRILG